MVTADPCAAILASVLEQTPIQDVLPGDLEQSKYLQIISPVLTNA